MIVQVQDWYLYIFYLCCFVVVLELVVSINVPVKQHSLKAGKGALRIRNTGFTITTCDNPPRCQGTWHIIHIRKYGGTDLFRFQTGKYAYDVKVFVKKKFNTPSDRVVY